MSSCQVNFAGVLQFQVRWILCYTLDLGLEIWLLCFMRSIIRKGFTTGNIYIMILSVDHSEKSLLDVIEVGVVQTFRYH